MESMSEIMEQIESSGGVSVVLGKRESYLAGVLPDMILADEKVGGLSEGYMQMHGDF